MLEARGASRGWVCPPTRRATGRRRLRRETWLSDDDGRNGYRAQRIEYNSGVIVVSWVVLLLDEVEGWYFGLDEESMTAVTGAIDLLEQEGPTLGRPTADTVEGSKFRNMKELRPAGTSPDSVPLRPSTPGRPTARRRQGRQLDELVRREHSDR